MRWCLPFLKQHNSRGTISPVSGYEHESNICQTHLADSLALPPCSLAHEDMLCLSWQAAWSLEGSTVLMSVQNTIHAAHPVYKTSKQGLWLALMTSFLPVTAVYPTFKNNHFVRCRFLNSALLISAASNLPHIAPPLDHSVARGCHSPQVQS